jgi:hypothetical protein
MSNADQESAAVSPHGRALCWIARIVTLVVVLFMAWGFVETLIRDLSVWLLLYLALLVLVLLGWWRHLLGGMTLILLSIPYLTGGVSPVNGEEESVSPFAYLGVGLALLGGGILHLLALWNERKLIRAEDTGPTPDEASPGSGTAPSPHAGMEQEGDSGLESPTHGPG